MTLARLWGGLCLAACLLLVAAPAGAVQQEIFFRVLDSHDNPQGKAQLTTEALAGAPATPPPFTARQDGMIHFAWLPVAQRGTGPGGDQHTRWKSVFRWRISAPGFLPTWGTVDLEESSRRMADPKLASLNREAKFAPHGETVVLRRVGELFAFKVPDPPDKDSLAHACLNFRAKNGGVARRLGARFAWPAFDRQDRRLDMLFDWVGAPWGSSAPAPLVARVALLTGLPLMLAAGQELPQLPGVDTLRLIFHSSIAPQGDELAMPEPAQVVLSAPLSQVRRLARGEISAGAFMAAHPPRLKRGR